VYPAAEILGPTSRPVCSLAVFLIMDENESFIEVEYIEGPHHPTVPLFNLNDLLFVNLFLNNYS
jgi:hypothetical protein